MRRAALQAVVALFGVTASVAALAADGRIEINEACAQVGCFAGDPPGYPIEITAPGSYLLTSDLVLPAGTSGILLKSDDVRIDLNDFAVRGPAVCAQGACGPVAGNPVGIGYTGTPVRRASVMNGAVVGIGGNGIRLGRASRVKDVLVSNVTSRGIWISEPNGHVTGCTVEATGFSGIFVQRPASVVEQNTVSASGFQNPNPTIVGARGGSGNACDDTACPRYRRYYMSFENTDGAGARNACALGFHMASLYELHDPSQLSYDWTHTPLPNYDTGLGPVTGIHAWVRTGDINTSGLSTQPGRSNCLGYTSNSPNDYGTVAALSVWWDLPALGATPWVAQTNQCSFAFGSTWCVED